ncbi:MAG: 16S rRNA (uracil(1498)-N(3))-methyltransferase [Pseudomonadales bacterium]
MRVPRIYHDSPIVAAGPLTLGERAARYLGQVLRLQCNSPVIAFDGCSGEWQAIITKLEKKSVQLDLQQFTPIDRNGPLGIHLGIGLSRGERMDWIVQKATELGVHAITPLLTERCEVKLHGERLAKRMRHWQAVSINACEQCGLNVLPELNNPVNSKDWAQQYDADLKLVLHPEAGHDFNTDVTPNSVLLAIGPEGGFTSQEVKQLGATDFTMLRLGERVLRTETAPLAALSILQHRWGDLRF